MAVKRYVGEPWHAICDDALEDSGFILVLKSDGHVGKAAADDMPIGVNIKSTEDPFKEGSYLSGVRVGIVSEGIVMVKLDSANVEIKPGDFLRSKGGGLADKWSEKDTTTAWPASYDAAVAETITDEIIAASRYSRAILGVALESKSAGSGGKIKVLLRLGRR